MHGIQKHVGQVGAEKKAIAASKLPHGVTDQAQAFALFDAENFQLGMGVIRAVKYRPGKPQT